MAQVEVGKQVNEVEGHEGKAEDDAHPFLTSFAWERQKNHHNPGQRRVPLHHFLRRNSQKSTRRSSEVGL